MCHFMKEVSASVDIRAPRGKVYSFLLDYEKWMKYNPSWDRLSVRKVTKGPVKEKTQYKVVIKPEGGEEETYISTVAELDGDRKICYEHSNARSTLFSLEDSKAGTRLTVTESFDASSSIDPAVLEMDLKHWLGGVKHYCELKKTPLARVSKLFIDKIMLRINPYQRRIAVLVIIIQLLLITTIVLAFIVIMVMRLLGREELIMSGL